jgi:citrate synthase
MWKTAIMKVEGEKILIRGYDLLKLTDSFFFGDLVLLMTTGKIPSLHQGKMMEAILVSCCDQGPLPPSTNAARFVASCGVPLQAAVAAGVLGFGQHHGGDIESCAKLLQESIAIQNNTNINRLADEIVMDYSAKNRRVPGFGNTYVDKDSRAVKLLQIPHKTIHPIVHIDFLEAVEKRLVQEKGHHLAANINGAVAAAVSDLGVDWQFGKGAFIISRSLGLIAHTLEEMAFDKPYKKVSVHEIEYIRSQEKEVPIKLEPS